MNGGKKAGRRPVVRYVRIPLDDVTHQALEECRKNGLLGGCMLKYHDSQYLTIVLREAIMALADRRREKPEFDTPLIPRFELAPSGRGIFQDGRYPERANEYDALAGVLANAEKAAF